MPDAVLLWGGVVAAAIAVDLGLLVWLQRRRRRPHWVSRPSEVLVFGVPSPTLSWLKYRAWPWVQARFPAQPLRSMPSLPDPAANPPEPVPASSAAPLEPAASSVPADPVAAAVVAPEVMPAEPARPAAPPPVRVTLEVPAGVSVRVTVETAADGTPVVHQTILSHGEPAPAYAPARFAPPLPAPPLPAPRLGEAWRTWWDRQPGLARVRAALGQFSTWEWAFFAGAMLIYAITRLVALDAFPIYFFSDEANIAMMGERVFQAGFRDQYGTWFPIYFEGAGLRWTPVLSVYFHGLASSLFGQSIETARATSAVISMLGVGAVALALKLVFKARFWWVSVFVLAVAPAWLIHTRTAFETVTMASFYACFLLCYLLYRERSPKYLYPALVFGAATFYTYSNAQLVITVAAGLLFLSDLPYHWQNRRTLAIGLLLAVVLAAPLLAFQVRHPEALGTHLRAVDSYMFKALPWTEKAQLYLQKYAYGLSPQYWFFPNETDLQRHRMPDSGQIQTAFLPFFLTGVALSLWQVRSSSYRAVLLAALAAPAGAALLDVGIARVMTFLMPATILIVLGGEWLLGRLPRLPERALGGLLFLGLGAAALLLFRNVLTNAPLWYRDYGLYGMQYGAKELFRDTIPNLLRRDSTTQIMLSSTWANGADSFIQFFIPPEDQGRVLMRNVDYYLFEKRPLDNTALLVMTAGEFDQARASLKFKRLDVETVLLYPDGTPGFYFARLEYADDIDAVFEAERNARRQPVTEEVLIDSRPVTVTHSRLDAGRLVDLLDGDAFTLARGQEANPLRFDFAFAEPQAYRGLALTLGSMDNFAVIVRVFAPDSATPAVYSENYANLPNDPTVRVAFPDGPASVARVEVEILNNLAGEIAQIHVREIAFEP